MIASERRPSTAGTDVCPPITAVVPTHRRPELMRRAVQSIVDQTYSGPIEIIVVFDACEPELPAVETSPLRVLRAVTNDRVRGLAGARNTGILAASHEFVAFLDDDDHWLPGKLEAQMAVFAAHPEVGLVGTAMEVDDGRRTHQRPVPLTVVTHDDLVRDRIAGLHSSSFVFRRSVLVDTVGMIDEELPGAYGEDYDVLLTTSQVAPIRLVNEPLVSVRWSGQSFFYGRWAQYAEGLTYLLDKHPGLREDPAALARMSSQIGFALAAAGRRREARPWLRRALGARRHDVRAWLGLLISFRLLSADVVARVANLAGKGI
ncbi:MULTISPECIES: glycosyltransferase family 2 protein [Aeromicrobium]|uniref:Glycosyltransferase n=1 Tax=Aeromicrobium yanjiei TaxID=2662028 RepID=A0A5Q2MKY6_9ACTN|nr:MULTISPECIES: glycosyltransferase family 2 protein [Aeromicrobium]MRK00714.1 glycosyltransferase [Aeromicrobium sp. S22]QGG42461.1 glycosyltransferase [Aeromicrobium yanjiei]